MQVSRWDRTRLRQPTPTGCARRPCNASIPRTLFLRRILSFLSLRTRRRMRSFSLHFTPSCSTGSRAFAPRQPLGIRRKSGFYASNSFLRVAVWHVTGGNVERKVGRKLLVLRCGQVGRDRRVEGERAAKLKEREGGAGTIRKRMCRNGAVVAREQKGSHSLRLKSNTSTREQHSRYDTRHRRAGG